MKTKEVCVRTAGEVAVRPVGNRIICVGALAAAMAAVTLAAVAGPPQGGGKRPANRAALHALRPQQGAPLPPPGAVPQFGDPLPGLTAEQLEAFADGREEFLNVESPEGGLGPIFNNTSCVACHATPATGGSSTIVVTRFGRHMASGFDALPTLGGSLLQDFAIDPAAQERVPAEANVRAHRQSTPLFGLGLIEAIPDQDIVRNALARKPDGVKGRLQMVQDVTTGAMRVGRFGWKAQQATLLAFSGDAYLNEMGVTSRFFPEENAPNGNAALLARYDATEDPEDTVDPATGKSDIDHAADFMRLLAPPPRVALSAPAQAGARRFTDLGCAVCHVPSFRSGPSAVAALSGKPVMLYSDLLLHDMGALGDGIVQGQARERDMKTAPLWGLAASGPYLHDGRAATVEEAVTAHDGEGAPARERFKKLTPAQRGELVAFLKSL